MEQDKNLYDNFEYIFDLLERKPYFLIADTNYNTLSAFLQGYFYSLGIYIEDEINYRLSIWVNDKGKKTALVWSAYILAIESNDDEELAKKNIFIKIREFFNDSEIDIKEKLKAIRVPFKYMGES